RVAVEAGAGEGIAQRHRRERLLERAGPAPDGRAAGDGRTEGQGDTRTGGQGQAAPGRAEGTGRDGVVRRGVAPGRRSAGASRGPAWSSHGDGERVAVGLTRLVRQLGHVAVGAGFTVLEPGLDPLRV